VAQGGVSVARPADEHIRDARATGYRASIGLDDGVIRKASKFVRERGVIFSSAYHDRSGVR
jgi:hypothetical protein